MKFSIARDSLLKVMSHVQSVVERRSSIAILANIKLEAVDSKLKATATDNDLTSQGVIDAFVEKEGVTTVNAFKLYEIVKKIPEGTTIEASVTSDGSRMNVNAGHAKFSLACLDADAFPDTAGIVPVATFDLEGDLLKKLVTKAQFAASSDDTRQYLNGVYMHVVKDAKGVDKLRFVATDGHRLARIETALPAGAEQMPAVIIPRKTVNELRSLAETSPRLQIKVADKKIQFLTDIVTLTSKVIDGTFPDYEKVIPQDNKKEMNVPRQALMQAVDRVAVLSHEKSRSVKFALKPNMLTITANNPDQENAVEELDVHYSDDKMDVGFNARYVSDISGLVEGNDINFLFKDGNSPVLMRDPKDPGSLFVLMPMRI